jgi:hypothetical protein
MGCGVDASTLRPFMPDERASLVSLVTEGTEGSPLESRVEYLLATVSSVGVDAPDAPFAPDDASTGDSSLERSALLCCDPELKIAERRRLLLTLGAVSQKEKTKKKESPVLGGNLRQ